MDFDKAWDETLMHQWLLLENDRVHPLFRARGALAIWWPLANCTGVAMTDIDRTSVRLC